MIQLKSVNKIFQSKDNDYAALKDVTLNIEKGEYVLITGKSGSGKSTLLNALTGVDTVSAGDIIIDGVNITSLDEAGLTKWRGQTVGIVFQFFQLVPTLSVLENILLPMDLMEKVPPGQREGKAHHFLEMVDMDCHADKMPASLSGGEQQRVAIARALANEVQYIIADEPTGNLDTINSQAIYDLLNNLHDAGKTIVMVTHDNDRIKGADRKIIMRDGRIENDYYLKGGQMHETVI